MLPELRHQSNVSGVLISTTVRPERASFSATLVPRWRYDQRSATQCLGDVTAIQNAVKANVETLADRRSSGLD
jgi:hypothetical protein